MRLGIKALAIVASMAVSLSTGHALAQATQGIGVYGPEGWTVLRPSQDTKFIFVSSSTGNDANDGLSPERPKRTIDVARRGVRAGYPDWVLLKRGDSWTEEFRWSGNGRSLEEPMVVAAYGDGDLRPIVQAPSGKNGFYIGTGNLRFIAITGMEFRAPPEGSGQSGIRIVADTGEGLLIEDCLVSGFKDNLSLISEETLGGFDVVQVRRNVIVDSAAPFGGHSQGMYCDALNQLLIEGNILDHNGWKENGTCPPTMFNHNIYVQDTCAPAIVRDNIIAQGSSHGLQLRVGGTAENNLFVRNALAMHTSRNDSTIRRNVVLEGRDIDGSNPRGFGIEIKPIPSGVVEQNIIAHRRAASSGGYAFQLHNSDTGVTNFQVTIRNNIVYDWQDVALVVRHPDLALYNWIGVRDNLFVSNDASAMIRFLPTQFDANKFQFWSNDYRTAQPSSSWFSIGGASLSLTNWKADTNEWNAQVVNPVFIDPERTVDTYWQNVIGEPGGFNEFMAQARKMSRAAWDNRFSATAVNAYIREGFGVQN